MFDDKCAICGDDAVTMSPCPCDSLEFPMCETCDSVNESRNDCGFFGHGIGMF